MEFVRSLYASDYYSTLHFTLIAIHVTAALVALGLAPAALAVVKGGKAHRCWGKIYFWSMMVVNSCAFLLLFWRFHPFLFGITVLTSYTAITGYRCLYRKRSSSGQRQQWFDWAVALTALVTGIGMIGWGLSRLMASGGFDIVGLLLLLFGAAVTANSFADVRAFRNPPSDRNWWWYYHMDRMIGSYIGLFTALMVQQVGPRLPGDIAWIVWIAPTMLGGVLVNRWIAHYRRQFIQRSVKVEQVMA